MPRALYSARLRELLERTRKDFDVVLIDVPPVLQFADARLIARLTDGLVLVLRSGITNREEALEACRRLDEDGVQLIGTILNDWIPTGSMARSYSYYSYESDET